MIHNTKYYILIYIYISINNFELKYSEFEL